MDSLAGQASRFDLGGRFALYMDMRPIPSRPQRLHRACGKFVNQWEVEP
jgi:hypothetical protein